MTTRSLVSLALAAVVAVGCGQEHDPALGFDRSNGLTKLRLLPDLYTSYFSGRSSINREQSDDLRRLMRQSAMDGAALAVPGRFLIALAENEAPDARTIDRVAADHRLTPIFRYETALAFAAVVPPERLSALRADPRVAFVSPDLIVATTAAPRPCLPGRFSCPRPPPQRLPTGIDRIDAENLANQGGGVHVAIIDTGIDYNHPDLESAIVGGINCADDGSSPVDLNGHGTHVAGIVAARDNGIGAVGVAPAASLWSVRVLGAVGFGTWSNVICGLDFVAAHGRLRGGPISVANMSLGGGGIGADDDCGRSNNDLLHQAICRVRDAGVVLVAAAGNYGIDASNFVPAAFDDAVITVSALADSDGRPWGHGPSTSDGDDDTFAGFSNYGPVVDLGAPGVDIYSTYYNVLTGMSEYEHLDGTSMAAPHVAGAAALYLAGHHRASWRTVLDALRLHGEPLGHGHTDPAGLYPEPVVRAVLF